MRDVPADSRSATTLPASALPASADVVVVGAGVAGCVMARRLADQGHDVVLLEAGADRAPDRAGFMDIGPDSRVVARHTARAGAQEFSLPRGRTLGGSGAINGGYCLPADPSELARWPAPAPHGSTGPALPSWPERYREGLRRALGQLRPQTFSADPTAAAVADAFPGTSVPVPQIRAGGRRVTAFDAWDPAGAGARVLPGVEVYRVEEYRVGGRDRSGRVWLADGRSIAAREVVLCAGTVGTTELLFRSGLGDDPARPVGLFAREHPELLLDLPPDFPRVAGPRDRDRDRDPPREHSRDPALPPLLTAVNRLRLDSGYVVEIRPFAVPFHEVVGGLGPMPHRIGVALMNPRGSGRINYRRSADEGSTGAGLVIDLEAAADPRDAAALSAAADMVGERLGLAGPAVRSTSHHLAGTAAVGTVVDAAGHVFGAPWLRVADAAMHHDLTTVGPYLSVAAIAEVLAGGVD